LSSFPIGRVEAIPSVELSSVLIVKVGKVPYINRMDDPLLTETQVEGTYFDANWWRWIEAQKRGLWMWSDWETAMAYRDWEWKRLQSSV
jgi:hypothetical protein